jgi:hypothetical protein
MKFTHKIVVAGICLAAAWFIYAGSQESLVSQEIRPTQTLLAGEMETGLSASTDDQAGDWLAAYESNGPEGERGVLMQKMSLAQVGLAVLVLASGGGLARLNKKRGLSGTHPNQ